MNPRCSIHRQISGLIAVNCIILGVPAQRDAAADSQKDFLTTVVRSLAKLHDTSGRFAGSAFVVGRDTDGQILLLTAHHVVDPHRNLDVDFYPHGSIDSYASTEIYACDVGRDLALLRVPIDRTIPALPTIDTRFLAPAELPAVVIGFPWGNLCTTQTAIVGVEYLRSVRGDIRKSWRLRDPVQPGTSGSPIIAPVQDAYRVIGVCRSSNEYHAYAVADVQTFLNKYAPLRKEPDTRSVISSRSSALTRSLHVLNMQLHHLVH